MDPDAYHESRAYPRDFESKFKMTTQFKTSNMVAFSSTGVIHKYDNVGEILEEFYTTRRAAYDARKNHELGRLLNEIRELNARHVFVKAVVDKRLVVANAEDDELLAGLKALELPPLSSPDSGDLRGYEYLLRMRVDRLKAAAVAELERELSESKAKYDALEAKTAESLWLDDLTNFDAAWDSFELRRKATYDEAAAVTSKNPVKKPAVKKRVVKKA
jgi:DNA topoisomerase-2